MVWGSTYLAIRVMVDTIPPMFGTAARFLAASLIIGCWLTARQGAWWRQVTRVEFVNASWIGTLMLVGGTGIVGVAEQQIPSGLAALVVAVVPLIVIALRRLGGEQVPVATLVSVVTGLAGVGLLLLPGADLGGGTLAGTLLVMLASLCWASGSYFSGRHSLPADTLVSACVQMTVAGVAAILIGTILGEVSRFDVSSFDTASLVAVAYLVLAGSVLAFTAYAWLLQHAPVSRVATYAYVNPVVAIALGALILDEAITGTIVVSGLVILASVAVTVTVESGARRRNTEVAGRT